MSTVQSNTRTFAQANCSHVLIKPFPAQQVRDISLDNTARKVKDVWEALSVICLSPKLSPSKAVKCGACTEPKLESVHSERRLDSQFSAK